MRTALILAFSLVGCSAEQGFGESKPATVEAGGEGRATIHPSDGVHIGPFEAGRTKGGGFRINSVGEFPLQVISMTLIDVGENAGEAVFIDLRPAVTTNVIPFDIAPEDSAEFQLEASMTEAGTATGEIEIYTNDPTANDGSPGYIRIPLSATATGSSSDEAPDDTGTSDGEDSGEVDPPNEDTGAGADPTDEGSDTEDADGDESTDVK